MNDVLRVSALHIYPIKSCGGIALQSTRVESRGLQYDRRFMLVDGNGRFLSQRQLPSMALLKTAIESDELRVSRPDGQTLRLPLQPSFNATGPVRIWRSELEASVADQRINEWFSDFFERPVQLVYMSEHQHRRVAEKHATQSDDEVSFADGAPILLIGEGSLAELNSRLKNPISMRRFRPNIVVDTAEAFAEDRWRHIRIDATNLEVAWSCARCTIPTVDPNTGVADPHAEPLRTLRAYRRDGPGVMFGQNLLTRGSGRLAVGSELEVIDVR